MKSLSVWLGGDRVGGLTQTRSGHVVWEPDSHWLRLGQRPPLGAAFLRDPRGRTAAGGVLPAWFENLLPERASGLRARLSRAHGVAESDSLGLLAALGVDLPGAVRVLDERMDGSEEGEPTPPEVAVASGILTPDRLRFSLAGVQLKLSMSAIGERFTVPAASDLGQFIVKIPPADYPELPAVEVATMRWARASGLDVPAQWEVPAEKLEGLPPGWLQGSASVYAIRRFDRRADGTRVHHEDFCQVFEFLPGDKYGGTGKRSVSYNSMLKLISDVAGREQAKEFGQRLGFVVASGNDDAHLKNWSLEWGVGHRPKLSPNYDLVSTIAWPKHGWSHPGGPELSLRLGREKRFGQLEREDLEEHERMSGVPDAAAAILSGIERARSGWQAVAETAPQGMRDAVEFHWRSVPLLRSLGPL